MAESGSKPLTASPLHHAESAEEPAEVEKPSGADTEVSAPASEVVESKSPVEEIDEQPAGVFQDIDPEEIGRAHV